MRSARVLLIAILTLWTVPSCGSEIDQETLNVAESLPVADVQIESAERIQVNGKAGRPDSGFPSFASVSQTYRITNATKKDAEDELRAAVESHGWVIDEEYDGGGWTTAVREFEGRYFFVRTGYSPSESTVTLWLQEWNRTTPLP